jgi:hypothetical protein
MGFNLIIFLNSQLARERGKLFNTSLYRVVSLAPLPTGFNICFYAKDTTQRHCNQW